MRLAAVGDVGQALLDVVQAGPEAVRGIGHRLVCGWRGSVVQQRFQVRRVQAERGRQGLQGSRAAAAFHGVVLDLADDRLRDVRALRQFALTQPSSLTRWLIAFATAAQSSDTYSSALRLGAEISGF